VLQFLNEKAQMWFYWRSATWALKFNYPASSFAQSEERLM